MVTVRIPMRKITVRQIEKGGRIWTENVLYVKTIKVDQPAIIVAITFVTILRVGHTNPKIFSFAIPHGQALTGHRALVGNGFAKIVTKSWSLRW